MLSGSPRTEAHRWYAASSMLIWLLRPRSHLRASARTSAFVWSSSAANSSSVSLESPPCKSLNVRIICEWPLY